MRKRLLLLLFVAGCTTTHLVCPENGVQTAVIGGSNIATFLSAMLPVATGVAAMFAAKAPQPRVGERAAASAPAQPQESYMNSHTLDIFGTTYLSCGNQPVPVPKS